MRQELLACRAHPEKTMARMMIVPAQSLPRTPLSLSGERAIEGTVPRALREGKPQDGIAAAEVRPSQPRALSEELQT